MVGSFSIATASGLIVATGAANALIWAARWTSAEFNAIIERLRVNAVVTGTITTAVPYDLEVYRARSFTVVPPSPAVVASLSALHGRNSNVSVPNMGGIYTLATQAAGMLSTKTSIREAGYKWTASPTGGAGSFYCEAVGGGTPTLATPSAVREDGVDMTLASAVAALPAGSYWYGDGDTLGYGTVYVHLADSADPDGKAAGYVEHWEGAVYTLDAHPLARISGATGTVIATQFFGAGPSPLLEQRPGVEPIILRQNEGLALRAVLAGPSTGTFRICVNMDWREAAET